MQLAFNPQKIPTTSVIAGCTTYFQISVLLNFKNFYGHWIRSQYPFIFDTGAGFSIAPESLMNYLELREEDTIILSGINSKPECSVTAKLAKVSYRIMNLEGKRSSEFQGWFAFHPFNQLFILGIHEMRNFDIHIEKASLKLVLKD